MQMTYRHGEIYSWTRRLPAAAASKFHRSRLSVSLPPSTPPKIVVMNLQARAKLASYHPLDRGPILMMEQISGFT